MDDVIIRRLISHITDLKLLIHEKSYKTYDKELKDYIVKQTGKENTYGNTCKTLTGLILLQKNKRR